MVSALSATDNTRDRSGKDAEEQFNGGRGVLDCFLSEKSKQESYIALLAPR